MTEEYYSPLTHETQAIVILVDLDKVRDIPVFHWFRNDRNGRFEHNTYKRQDVLVSKPPPSNNFSNEELWI